MTLFEPIKKAKRARDQVFGRRIKWREQMRNTTMQDALTDILTRGVNTQLEHQTDEAVLSAVKATRRKLTKKTKEQGFAASFPSQNKPKSPAFAPRYIDPRRKNPFAVHVHPAAFVPEPRVEAEPELEIKESEQQVPVVETKQPETEASPKIVNVPIELKSPVEVTPATPAPIPEKQPENPRLVLEPFPEAREPHLFEEKSQPETPALPETPVIDSEYEDVETEPAIVLPSNLEWLKKPTPFSTNLTAIVDELRDARQRVIFTLEQYQARQKELRKQLDAAEYGIEEQKENLRVLDDNISACALVAEQSANLKPGLLVANPIHHHRHTESKMGTPFASVRTRRRDPASCHPDDLIQFFKANSGVNWSVAEVYKGLPASKKEHTEKQQIYAILSALAKSGRLQRVGNGIYRMDKTVDSE